MLPIIIAVAWSVLAGLLGRAMFSRPRPGIPFALIAGGCGWGLAFAADGLAGLHAFHPFRPESLLPATALALAILSVGRHYPGRRSGRRTIFY